MTADKQLGKYRILDELGKGGFATVYRALDTTLDREVALKVLDPLLMRDEKWVKHFRQEAKTVAALEHPYIVGIYEIGEVQDRLYIAMTLAKGGSLAQVLADQGRLPWSKTLAVLQLVCEALDYAHGQGVVHRDLKPANVLLDPGGPLLTDFGFARLLVDNSMSMSLSGGILGTPAYIAPEIWEYDHAEVPADVYALGCITYEMLVGEPLFGGKTPMQVMRAHDKGPQFADVWPGAVPKGFSTVLRKALAREPETRYPAAGSFWYALKDLEAQAEAGREAAERAAVAAQWRAEAEAAVEEGEWRAAKMAVGRCLAVTPDDAEAQTLQKEIEQRLRQSKTPTDPLEKPYQYLQRLLADQRWAEAQRQAQAILAKDPHYRDVADLAQRIYETRVNAQSGEARSSVVGGSQQLTRTQQRTLLQVLAVTVAVFILVMVILDMVAYVDWSMFVDDPNDTGAVAVTATVTLTRTPPPTPTPTLAPGATRVREADGMTMVYVPAGEFEMGSTDGYDDEQPVHTVALDAFWLDQTEVTNAQYQTCVTAGKCDEWRYADDSDFNAADQPVVGVSWSDAVDYCAWVGGRLPTEAEWEYAARGPEGFVYPWGDSWQPGLANCDEDDCEDGFEYMAPVGSFPAGASWVGALDMVGNVWEWVADWYDAEYYARSPRENPTGPEEGETRVLRGGSWSNWAEPPRSGSRWGGPRPWYNNGGFRCVRTSPPVP